MAKVCILDYGSGNVRSVFNMVSYLGYDVTISNDISTIQSARHLILPGVGAFGSAMKKIRANVPLSTVEAEVLNNQKPFLGICVGMQVLAEKGFEHEAHEGLGWITGSVEKLQVHNQPLPHIGWNDIIIRKQSIILDGFNDVKDFYFVHSYAVVTDESLVLSETYYDQSSFCSSIQKDNIFGVQFHPEKSQKAGWLLLRNFLSIK